MSDYSFVASDVWVDGVIVIAENVNKKYHYMLMGLWECICISAPLL